MKKPDLVLLLGGVLLLSGAVSASAEGQSNATDPADLGRKAKGKHSWNGGTVLLSIG